MLDRGEDTLDIVCRQALFLANVGGQLFWRRDSISVTGRNREGSRFVESLYLMSRRAKNDGSKVGWRFQLLRGKSNRCFEEEFYDGSLQTKSSAGRR
jgi:hypothetical protein